MQEFSIFRLFPTAVGAFNLNRDLSSAELDILLNLETRPNDGNLTSTESFLFKKHKPLKHLNKFMLESASCYFKNIFSPKNESLELYITQSWCNFTKNGGYHHSHMHPNSIVSGVFYIETDENDKIFFNKPQINSSIKIPSSSYNEYNSETWWLPAKKLQLLIFPSYLVHFVERVNSEKQRISLSFNTFLRGDLGDLDKLTSLNLK